MCAMWLLRRRRPQLLSNGRWLASLCVSVLVLLLLAEACAGAHVAEVYRLLQYDLEGVPLGSRRAALAHHATLSLTAYTAAADLQRVALVLPLPLALFTYNPTQLRELLISPNQTNSNNKRAAVGALLLVLPKDFHSNDVSVEMDDVKAITELEQLLIDNNLSIPVYFALENDNLASMLKDLTANDAAGVAATPSSGGYKLQIVGPEPTKLSPTLENYQGFLPGDKTQDRTIAVVAHYDTFAAAPGLAVGADDNGSGVAGLLALCRLFSALYADPHTRGIYNFWFLLTSAGQMNYEGAKQWLAKTDVRLLETLDLVLCLDSLGSWTLDTGLYLHVSRPMRDPAIQRLSEAFGKAGAALGVSIETVAKKINESHVAWEHEHFAKQRILAATLTSRQQPSTLFAPSLLDHRVNATAVELAVQLAAEALAVYAYSSPNSNATSVMFANNDQQHQSGVLSISRPFLDQWLLMLAKTPRFAPFIPKSFPLTLSLQAALQRYTAVTQVVKFTLDPKLFEFYGTQSSQMQVFQVASVGFDVFLAAAIGAYLAVLYGILHILSKGTSEVAALFRKPMMSRKLKYT